MLLPACAVLLLAGCANGFGAKGARAPDGPPPEHPYLSAHGTALYRDGEPQRLRAIAFDNGWRESSPDVARDRHHGVQAYASLAGLGIDTVLFDFGVAWFERDSAGLFTWIDGNLALARRAGIALILRPRAVDTEDPDIDTSDMWQQIAQRYRDDATVAGYALATGSSAGDDVAAANARARTVAAIRAVDERHLIVVPGIGSGASSLDDDNVLHDVPLSPVSGAGYPDAQAIVPTDISRVDRQTRLSSTSVPAGSSDWAWYASDWAAPDNDVVAGAPRLIARGPLGGRVQLSALTVRERDADGRERIVFQDTIGGSGAGRWQRFAYDTAGDTVAASYEAGSAVQDASLSLSLGGTGLSTAAGWQASHGWFRVAPRSLYRVEGRLRADALRYIAGQRGSAVGVEVEFHAPLDRHTPVFLANDRTTLARSIDAALESGRTQGVPVAFLSLRPDVALQDSADAERWLSDAQALLAERNASYGIGGYRGATGALYPSPWDEPLGEPDAAMVRVLSAD